MIPAFRRAWFRWQLRKTLKKDTQRHAFLPFDQVHRMLLVVQLDQPESVSITQTWLKKWQPDRQVTLLAYFPSRKKPTFDIPFPYITPKDLTFGFQPKTTVDWQQAFDALICVMPGLSLPGVYIAAHAKATMRVGPHPTEFESCLDLMVALPDNKPSLDTIFNTFDKYLKMIRNHEPTA